mgnify:CR=1 FL=1
MDARFAHRGKVRSHFTGGASYLSVTLEPPQFHRPKTRERFIIKNYRLVLIRGKLVGLSTQEYWV